mmetsp:Transcript_5299/g.13406  ORF Transcript_5299/g.13406 Transcript_5299/m.13406 type:complete len:212 (-) Transcript_5299:1327-1962(-)
MLRVKCRRSCEMSSTEAGFCGRVWITKRKNSMKLISFPFTGSSPLSWLSAVSESSVSNSASASSAKCFGCTPISIRFSFTTASESISSNSYREMKPLPSISISRKTAESWSATPVITAFSFSPTETELTTSTSTPMSMLRMVKEEMRMYKKKAIRSPALPRSFILYIRSLTSSITVPAEKSVYAAFHMEPYSSKKSGLFDPMFCLKMIANT